MVLRSITVSGVKCFRDEFSVGRFGDGLNMIFGGNEIGKSTLVEATARALFDDYKSTGEEIRDLQPWQTTLAPEITLEFEAGGDAYRRRKRLLSGHECVLSRMESDAWCRLHERDGADEFVRRLLHGEGSHGASDLRHWGLARMLWCLRDPSMIGRDEGAGACRVSTAVAEQLRQVLPGAATMGTAYDAVMSAVEGRYTAHFTVKRETRRRAPGANRWQRPSRRWRMIGGRPRPRWWRSSERRRASSKSTRTCPAWPRSASASSRASIATATPLSRLGSFGTRWRGSRTVRSRPSGKERRSQGA